MGGSGERSSEANNVNKTSQQCITMVNKKLIISTVRRVLAVSNHVDNGLDLRVRKKMLNSIYFAEGRFPYLCCNLLGNGGPSPSVAYRRQVGQVSLVHTCL